MFFISNKCRKKSTKSLLTFILLVAPSKIVLEINTKNSYISHEQTLIFISKNSCN